MGNPAATMNSQVMATDTHIVLVPTPGGPMPTPLPHVFSGAIMGATVPTVNIGGQAAATQDSIAFNNPPHIAMPPGVSFQMPPNNQGKVILASMTVFVGGKGLARVGDMVETCNDPAPLPVGTITGAVGTVFAG